MTFEKIKNADVYKGAGYNDDSHPNGGNLVLLNEGMAFFGGATYRRDGYPLPKEVTKPAPTSRFKAGDRVVLKNDGTHGHGFVDRTGIVLADTFTSDRYGFDIHVNVDNNGPAWFYDREVEFDFAPTPPPVTHRYPEGLYQGTTDTGTRVYIQHEERTDRYAITYLSGPRDEQGIPAVNKYMSAGIVASYTLVTAA